jgi:hypothetical protein
MLPSNRLQSPHPKLLYTLHLCSSLYFIWLYNLCSWKSIIKQWITPVVYSLLYGSILILVEARVAQQYSTGLGLEDEGFKPRQGWEFFSSPPRPDWFWDPPSLLSSGHQGLFAWG